MWWQGWRPARSVVRCSRRSRWCTGRSLRTVAAPWLAPMWRQPTQARGQRSGLHGLPSSAWAACAGCPHPLHGEPAVPAWLPAGERAAAAALAPSGPGLAIQRRHSSSEVRQGGAGSVRQRCSTQQLRHRHCIAAVFACALNLSPSRSRPLCRPSTLPRQPPAPPRLPLPFPPPPPGQAEGPHAGVLRPAAPAAGRGGPSTACARAGYPAADGPLAARPAGRVRCLRRLQASVRVLLGAGRLPT